MPRRLQIIVDLDDDIVGNRALPHEIAAEIITLAFGHGDHGIRLCGARWLPSILPGPQP